MSKNEQRARQNLWLFVTKKLIGTKLSNTIANPTAER
jgi:hypothetical protein